MSDFHRLLVYVELKMIRLNSKIIIGLSIFYFDLVRYTYKYTQVTITYYSSLN